MHEHDGYAPHSHEVRADHLGVLRNADDPTFAEHENVNADQAFAAWYRKEFGADLTPKEQAEELANHDGWLDAYRSAFEAGRAFQQGTRNGV